MKPMKAERNFRTAELNLLIRKRKLLKSEFRFKQQKRKKVKRSKREVYHCGLLTKKGIDFDIRNSQTQIS